jgi:alpha-tubulin suppressor-like RCC1 family protein
VASERALPLGQVPPDAELRARSWQMCAWQRGALLGCWLDDDLDAERTVVTPEQLVRSPEVATATLVDFVSNGRRQRDTACGVDRRGRAWCWGEPMPDENEAHLSELPPAPTLERPTAVAALAGVRSVGVGGDHACALARAGQVHCWGSNLSGQLGHPDLEPSRAPRRVQGLPAAVELSVGHEWTCARTRDGAVYCWGRFDTEPLLVEDVEQVPEPAPETTRPGRVEGIAAAVQLDVGHSHACAVRRDRRVVCWGRNEEGQLGNGAFDDSPTPVEVTELDDVVSVDASVHHTCALRADGTVWCWGMHELLGRRVTTP